MHRLGSLRRGLWLLLSGLALAATALVVFRLELVEFAARHYLSGRGVAVGSLEAVALDFKGAALNNLRLGNGDELQADRLTLSYDLPALLSGQLNSVQLDGLRLRLDVSGAAPPLGSLQVLLPSSDDAPAPPEGAPTGQGQEPETPAIPEIVVTGALLQLATPAGPAELRFDAEVWAEDRAALAATAQLAIESTLGTATATLSAVRQSNGDVLGDIAVTRGRLRLPGAEIAGLRGQAAFQLPAHGAPLANGQISAAQLDIEGPDTATGRFEQARLAIDLGATDLRLEGELSAADDGLQVLFDAAVEDYPGRPQVALQLYGESDFASDAAGDAWALLARPRPNSGSGTLLLALFADLPQLTAASFPPLEEPNAVKQAALAWLRGGLFDGTLLLDVGDLALDGMFSGLSGSATLEILQASQGQVRIRNGDDTALRVAALEPAWLQSFGLPADLAALLAPGFALDLVQSEAQNAGFEALLLAREGAMDLQASVAARLATASGTSLHLTAAPNVALRQDGSVERLQVNHLSLDVEDLALQGYRLDRGRIQGELSGPLDSLGGNLDLTAESTTLRLPEASIAGLALRLPLQVALDEQKTFRAALREPGLLTLSALELPGAAVAVEAFELALQSGEMEIDFADGLSINQAVTLRSTPIALRLVDQGTVTLKPGSIALRGTASRVAGYSGHIDVGPSAVESPDMAVAVSGFTLQARHGLTAESLAGEFEIAELRHLGEPALAAPVKLSGSFAPQAPNLAFEVIASGLDGGQWLSLAGLHGPAQGKTVLSVTAGPLEFQPSGLQPARLFPPLAWLTRVTGRGSSTATLSLESDSLSGNASLDLDDLAFETPQAKVSGLQLDLTLDSLWPPHSPAGQRLAIALLDPGLPVREVQIAFQILPHPTAGLLPKLRIEGSDMKLLGGRVYSEAFEIDPNADSQQLTLKVSALDLAEVFGLLGMEELSGGGLIEGEIPLTLAGPDVVIEGGWLATRAPGRLSLKSEAAASMLSGTGEEVTYLLRALEDFHYRKLELRLDKSAADDVVARLSLLGNNPEVLEGQDFQLNLNVESNIGQILTAVGEALRISNEALRRTWQLH